MPFLIPLRTSRRLLCLLLGIGLGLAPATPAQTVVPIHDVMTNLPNSPFLGGNVTTTGVVVGTVDPGAGSASRGFYMSLQANVADPNSVGGIFVAGSSVAACNAVAVGQLVTVTGTVTNSTAPNLTAANTPGTFLVPTACSANGTQSLAQTVSLGGVLTSFGDALKYTGQSVANHSFYAVGPTSGTLPLNGSAVVSTGQFWATLNANTGTNNHLFRSTGIAEDEYTPAGAPATVTAWSGNPQRVLIDTTSFGGQPIDVAVGQAISCTNTNTAGPGATQGIGVVDYTLGFARIMLFQSVQCTVSGGVPAAVSAVADDFKIGTLDVNTFLGSASIFQIALSKATMAVTGVFGSPDIMALQEVGGQDTLQYLADAANATNGGRTSYIAKVLGTDLINSGFLVDTNTVKNANYIELGRGATYTTSAGASASLWDHPPLILMGEVARVGKNYPVTVINVHLAERDGIDDATLGADVRTRRAAQAAAVSTLVQQYQAGGRNVVVAGNFNGYEFSDGSVDVLGVIRGMPAAASAVTLYQPSSTTGALTDFTTQVPANSRYNIIERGNAAALEHILVSSTVVDAESAPASLASYVNLVTQPHFSTDYSAVSANDPNTPAGLTPHDGFLVNFAIPPVPTTASLAPATLGFGDVSLGNNELLSTTVTNTTQFASTIHVTSLAISGANASDFTQTSTCTALGAGSSCTVSVTFAPAASGGRSAVLTVLTDATGNPSFTVPLSGNGIDTTASLTPSATLNFGDTTLGSSKLLTTTVTNTTHTTSNIRVKDIAISGTNGADFKQTSDCTTLAAGSSCTVSVTFAPSAIGARNAVLTVLTDATGNASLAVPLTGSGIDSAATLTPASADYGLQTVSTTSAPKVFVWTNTSSAALAIASVDATGDYAVTATNCIGTIAANASCTASVIFKPIALGTRTGTLAVVSAASRNGTLTASLTGIGVTNVQADTDGLGFGTVDVGSRSVAKTIQVTNLTSAAVPLGGVSVSGDYAMVANTCGSTLSGGGSCAVSVVFAPVAIGQRVGALAVTTADARSPVIAVALTGNGVDFAVAVTATSGSVLAGLSIAPVATVTALGGFSAPITMGCTTAATGTACNFATASFTLARTATNPLTITTTSQYTVIGYGQLLLQPGHHGLLLTLLGLAGALTLLAGQRRARCTARLPLALLAVALTAGAMNGCSGKLPDRNTPYTLPGTYDVLVTATDGTITHAATYSLTVTAK
ncbi:MAG: choice-of-anchor D domain-containing protein [Janthinobacterium lividum]